MPQAKQRKNTYTPPEDAAVMTQAAIFYAPRNQYETVAIAPDGVKHNGFGSSPEAAYEALRKSLTETGYKGEVYPARRAGNVGLAQTAGAEAYNAKGKPATKKAEGEEAETEKPAAVKK